MRLCDKVGGLPFLLVTATLTLKGFSLGWSLVPLSSERPLSSSALSGGGQCLGVGGVLGGGGF